MSTYEEKGGRIVNNPRAFRTQLCAFQASTGNISVQELVNHGAL